MKTEFLDIAQMQDGIRRWPAVLTPSAAECAPQPWRPRAGRRRPSRPARPLAAGLAPVPRVLSSHKGKHHPNEFVVLVGTSAKARKGSSFDHVARLLAQADPAFGSRLTTGLSSGEGLIWAVRDPHGQDPGAVDKRLLVVEPEFAWMLKSTGRELSTLSPTLRSAWDGRPLALLTRTAPARATAAHISIIGHITQTAGPEGCPLEPDS